MRIQVHIGSEKIGCGLPQVLDGSRLQGQFRSLEVRPRLKLTCNISVTIDNVYVYTYVQSLVFVPAVPHKAAAEVSKIGNL